MVSHILEVIELDQWVSRIDRTLNHILVIIEGYASCELSPEIVVTLTPGDSLLVPSEQSAQVNARPGSKAILTSYDPNSIVWNITERHMIETLFSSPRHLTHDAQFLLLCRALLAERDTNSSIELVMNRTRSLLLYSVFDRVECNIHSQKATSSRIDLCKVEDYIQKHMSEQITVSELANLCNISVSRFHAYFRQFTNQSPYQYIVNRRVENAARMIRTTSLPINTIAEKCGFTSRKSLNIQIKRFFGMSPSNIRQTYAEEIASASSSQPTTQQSPVITPSVDGQG